MKRFLIRLGIFSFLTFVALNATGWLLIKTGRQGHAVENSRIYHSLAKARKNLPDSAVFVFGDSVANQMYPPEVTNGRINSLALVMPSTLAGQYFLLRRLADTNNLSGKAVVLVISPESFASDLSHWSSYHYVLKPFFNREFHPWDDPLFRERVQQNLVAKLSQLPIVNSSNWNPPRWMPYLKHEALDPGHGMSAFSAHYLRKMKVLTTEAGATLKVLPTIQAESKRGREYEELRDGIKRFGLDELFGEYFEAFHYFPNQAFSDGVHVRNRKILGDNLLGL